LADYSVISYFSTKKNEERFSHVPHKYTDYKLFYFNAYYLPCLAAGFSVGLVAGLSAGLASLLGAGVVAAGALAEGLSI
jgi:hypothetical protein